MTIIDVVVEVHELLTAACPRHAFGGALALAYYAEPRATVDIDVNVFPPDAELGAVVGALATAGYAADPPSPEPVPAAAIRFRREIDPFPVDLFPPLGRPYDEIADRIRWWPFGPQPVELPFLSVEDLTLFKLSFGRRKDWTDLEQLVASGTTLDVDYVERQLIELRGPTMYPRLARLRALVG